MDVKAVLHNLVTKGPLETYGIHYYNKRKAEEIKQSHGKNKGRFKIRYAKRIFS